MARRIYAQSRWPRASSMSRRIASNSAARASMSASLRWAYSATSAMAIDASRTFRPGALATYSRDDAQPGEIGEVLQHRGSRPIVVGVHVQPGGNAGTGGRAEVGGQPAEQDVEAAVEFGETV